MHFMRTTHNALWNFPCLPHALAPVASKATGSFSARTFTLGDMWPLPLWPSFRALGGCHLPKVEKTQEARDLREHWVLGMLGPTGVLATEY